MLSSFSFVAYLPLVLLLVHALFLHIYHVHLRSIVATKETEEENYINSPISLFFLPDHRSFDSFHRMECLDCL